MSSGLEHGVVYLVSLLKEACYGMGGVAKT